MWTLRDVPLGHDEQGDPTGGWRGWLIEHVISGLPCPKDFKDASEDSHETEMPRKRRKKYDEDLHGAAKFKRLAHHTGIDAETEQAHNDRANEKLKNLKRRKRPDAKLEMDSELRAFLKAPFPVVNEMV